MNTIVQRKEDSRSQTDQDHEEAVPYIPPPPPEQSSQKKSRSPFINGALFAGLILLIGFMGYNYAGHQLTRLSSATTERVVSPTPSISPTLTPVPSM
jgi:hypothetical protein